MYRAGHELNAHLINVTQNAKICGGQHISIIKQKYHSIIEIVSGYIAFESIATSDLNIYIYGIY